MVQIYLKLNDEGTPVWRPVEASENSDGTYTISENVSVPDDEKWEFGPGERVACKWQMLSGETPVLVAYELA